MALCRNCSTPDGCVVSNGIILHLFGWDKKFTLPFRDLIHEYFADGRHKFIVYGDISRDALEPAADTSIYPSLLKNFFAISKAMYCAEKIILHGLFSSHLLYILALQPWVLKKCHWVIWGGDLYVHETELKDRRWKKNEFFRRLVIRRIGHFLTYVPGDMALARLWYGAKGKYHKCLMYTSNIYKELVIPPKTDSVVSILVGNSGDPTNNHLDVFEKLSMNKTKDLMIYCPLSYGGTEVDYAKQVAKKGAALFGDRFVALTEFIPFAEYLTLLGNIDIAVFAHNRQQGMGNIINLLGLGKKVYLRSDVTSWHLFDGLGVKVFDFHMLDLTEIDDRVQSENKIIVENFFSKAALLKQWQHVFQG